MRSLILIMLLINCLNIKAQSIEKDKLFLENSYSFYSDCFPDSINTIIEKFISFCDTNIDLTPTENNRIKEALSIINTEDTCGFEINKYYFISIDEYYDKLVKYQPVISRLENILPQEKLDYLREKMKEHLYQVIKIKNDLFNCYIKKRNQNKDGNNIFYFTDLEEFMIVKELIFKQNNGIVKIYNAKDKKYWDFNIYN